MILNDNEISKLCRATSGMISPFILTQCNTTEFGKKIISRGLSSFGYDATLDTIFRVFSSELNPTGLIDPKKLDTDCYTEVSTYDPLVIAPHGFILASTVEYFRIPDDVVALCVGKSTYARCGLVVNVTPLEPGWEGYVTLELSNTSPYPLVVYPLEGICQFLFFRGNPPLTNYRDRNGKYNKQMTITNPIV